MAMPLLKHDTITAHTPVAVLSAPAADSAAAADDFSARVAVLSTSLWEGLGLADLGLTRAALDYGVQGYLTLQARGALPNDGILTVIDFSRSSHTKRLYIIDMERMELLVHTYVAHGKNSGLNYATRFSDTPESLQSSLGFYVTKGTYFGKHGLSLKLDGQERGFNANAEARAVVVHGADYIGPHRLSSAYMGRSFGCPAVPSAEKDKVIGLIKNGTCLFIYHPDKKYLDRSPVLNA